MSEFGGLEFEDVEVGPGRARRRHGRGNAATPRRRVWWPWAVLAGLTGVVVGTVVLSGGGDDDATPTSVATTASSPSTTVRAVTTTGPTTTSTARATTSSTTSTTLPAVAGPTGVRLVARTASDLVEIDVDAGPIRTTPAPPSSYRGSAMLASGPGWVVMRSPETGTGVLIRPDRPAVPLGSTECCGPGYRGPDGALWILAQVDNTQQLELVDVEGVKLGVVVPMPLGYPTGSDGRTGVLVEVPGGTYVAGPLGYERISSGQVLATGPTTFVAVECDDRLACGVVVADWAGGPRRPVPVSRSLYRNGNVMGRVSPNGRLAAMIEWPQFGGAEGEGELRLMDLVTGETDVVAGARIDASVVFSPDSRFLFYVGTDGVIHVIDRERPQERFAVATGGDDDVLEIVEQIAP